MSKHTPGPWAVNELDAWGEASEFYIFIEPGVAVIERKCAGSDQCDMPDARLIAAAPELLEALKGLDEAYCRAGAPLTREERNEDRQRLIAARAAIAKATGERP